MAHRRPDTVIAQDWSVHLDTTGAACTDAKLVDSGQLLAALVGRGPVVKKRGAPRHQAPEAR
ncbi:hypothetical protein [Streptomyces platensis]|uniref:hypothetical protein n=1 Tax=Streptomyces platensis TaxID=58346 RepID=UPI0037973431